MTLSPENIVRMLEGMKAETRAITKQAMTICWYMRSMGREEVYSLSPMEREEVMKIIDDNIERTKKSGMPLL